MPGGVAWSCPRCDGRTATFGLLRKGLADDTLRSLVERASAPDARQGVTCPSCLRSMHEVTLRTPDGYQEVDICKPCTFVWFDPGEYHAMAGLAEPPPLPGLDPGKEPLEHPKAVEAMARMQIEQADNTRRFPKDGWKWLPGLLGMPVEFDDGEPAATPIFTYALVAIVTLISGVVLLGGRTEEVFQAYGFKPSEAWRMGGLTALSMFFLHAGWFHLLGNMYFLLVFGDNCEDVLGPKRFLLLLLLATLFGSVLHAFMTQAPTIPAVGASGGISGIIGYYALRFPKMRIGKLILFVWWLRFPTRVAFGIWVALQLFGAFVMEGNVAYMAHLGGALVGVLFFFADKWIGEAPVPDGRRARTQQRYDTATRRYGSRADRYGRGDAHTNRYTRR